MILSLLYIILAALGLGFLIFIHELGHYWMARREGMTVEIFSIGFGKPLYTWERDGVKWQLCMLPFGGFVRIAGMEKSGSLEPYQIPNGFYGKRPLARIKVALMGPVVNICFAFIAFSILWLAGGRWKPFSEFTHLIGWVDPTSAVYQAEIRPGDQIDSLNGKPFKQFQDLLYAAVLDEKPPEISGEEVDYLTQVKKPFKFQFPLPKDATVAERVQSVFGSLAPANFLIYNRYRGRDDGLSNGSPMAGSGIEYGDRIIWVDGELIFSKEQLISTVNQSKVLLTILRNQEILLVKVPRLKISDLRINSAQKAELEDWQHENRIGGKLGDQYFIPYNLDPNGVVEAAVAYLNEETLEQNPVGAVRSALEIPLESGDHILAVGGIPVANSVALFKQIQTRALQIIVKKEDLSQTISWKDADAAFLDGISWPDLQKMAQSIGTGTPIGALGDLKLLNPVVPKPRSEFPFPEEFKTRLAKDFEQQQAAAEKIENLEQREQALQHIQEAQNQLLLGVFPMDRRVRYNPSPFALFSTVFQETWRTLFALFSGNVSPKYMQGPVGIVQVLQHSWSVGIKEAIFWLGMISLNLGVLNLLPIPVLDGGHICFSLWEWITKKPIKAKTMERLIIPFVILLITLFIYLTYHDLSRLLSRFF